MSATYDFLISRSDRDDHYKVWRFDPQAEHLLTPMQLGDKARFDRTHQLIAVGGYLLDWAAERIDGKVARYAYRLFPFDPTSADPLEADAVRTGEWPMKKFFGYRAHYSRSPDEGELLQLIPLTSFMMSLIPAEGRGTFELWNFDPMATDQQGLPDPIANPYTGQEAFPTIQAGHELIPVGNYVLDRLPDNAGFRLWSFDPQNRAPLAQPPVQQGQWSTIDASHRLVVVGEMILDWVPEDRSYRLWRFDPNAADPLCGLVREGKLPQSFGAHSIVTAVQPTIPVQSDQRDTPGTIDFMRSRIKHVVYFMLESRSFDNVLGWLYEKGQQGVQFVGSDEPFHGVSAEMFNDDGDRRVHVSKFKEGKLSEEWVLGAPDQDPFHGNTDGLLQMFSEGTSGYYAHARPDMGGFVRNNAQDEVMLTFTPEQLPVLNGLAKHFGVSDAWFCSVPGGTDINRAFAVSGSSYGLLATWEGGDAYKYFPKTPHRQSIWKVLWSNGIRDWKIYSSASWKDFDFTYHLYLEGQIPTVDADTASYVAEIEQFKQDARQGKLPAFSYLEPVWFDPNGGTTSYHPGTDLVPAEKALNDIYDALRSGPAWNETLLIITFSKNGGIYDHVPPPYARKPWPNDVNDGFQFDIMGPRVPAIVVSPWVKKQTVFRAGGQVPFDATSFAATLLNWFGIPKARWGLGDRVHHAPTLEGVLLEESPRRDAPVLTPPYDKDNPPKDAKRG